MLTMSDRLFRVALFGRVPDDDESVIAEANDEIERMRAALEKIARLGEEGMKPNYEEWLTFHDKVAQIAREASLNRGKGLVAHGVEGCVVLS
jgi:hypothetical protein